MRRLTWTTILAALPLAACGNSRTPVQSVTQPAAPNGVRPLVFAQAGIGFSAPRNWAASLERSPLLATVTSGTAIVAVWHYRRHGTPATLAAARRALIAAARARDPSLRVMRASLGALDGAPAVTLIALETINGQARQVRSIHIFRRAAEFVIDEYAPPALFESVDREVFTPLAQSVRLFG